MDEIISENIELRAEPEAPDHIVKAKNESAPVLSRLREGVGRHKGLVPVAAAMIVLGGGWYHESQEVAELRTDNAEQLRRINAQHQTLEELLSYASRDAGVSTSTILRQGLRKPSELPYADVQPEVSLAAAKEHATLLMATRARGDRAPWKFACNATLVSIGGVQRVVTARHCLKNDLADSGDLRSDSAPSNSSAAHIESSLLENVDVGFFAPEANATRTLEPLFEAREVSYSTDSDTAMMAVRDNDDVVDDITALETKDVMFRPEVGAQVALDAMPASGGFQLEHIGGVYIGRARFGGADLVDVVLTSAQSSHLDPCSYGASGSMAVVGGALTGPLSTRLNISQGRMKSDYGDRDVRQDIEWQIEDALHISTDGYNVACGYAIVSEDQLQELSHALEESHTEELDASQPY